MRWLRNGAPRELNAVGKAEKRRESWRNGRKRQVGSGWLMSEQRVAAGSHSADVYNRILFPTLPAVPRRRSLPPPPVMSNHPPPHDRPAVRPPPPMQPRAQSAVARSSVGGLLNSRRPVSSTPIPPSLQAKMAAVSAQSPTPIALTSRRIRLGP